MTDPVSLARRDVQAALANLDRLRGEDRIRVEPAIEALQAAMAALDEAGR